MACTDWTPFTMLDYPHTVNRLRISGGETDQATGEWIPETTSSIEIKGYLGVGDLKKSMSIDSIQILMGGKFQTGDLYFACHNDCDVLTNDVLEVYDDAAGTTKSYWRIISYTQELTETDKLAPFGRNYYLTRREER